MFVCILTSLRETFKGRNDTAPAAAVSSVLLILNCGGGGGGWSEGWTSSGTDSALASLCASEDVKMTACSACNRRCCLLLLQAEFTGNVIASDMNNVSEQTVADSKEKQYFGTNGNTAGMGGGLGGSGAPVGVKSKFECGH